MFVIAKIKSVNESATAVQVAEMLEATSRELKAAEAELARLDRAHRSVLLADDDKALDRHEQQTTAARRQVARLRALVEVLEERHSSVIKRETEEALDRRKAEAVAAVANVIRRLDTEYAPAAETIAAFLPDWVSAINLTKTTNEALHAAGRSDLLLSPEVMARKAPNREEPAREEIEIVRGPTQWEKDPRTGEMRAIGQSAHEKPREVRRTIAARVILGDQLPPLAESVALPAARPGKRRFWGK
ncbi:hypothetical protein ACCD06_15660 [Azospirillum sp. CT11-132]|uniref:hypothetical protein n=1 Tax=Azospirillum sp. CT11-132 TaxID=3396317 RepID=UPI0039A73FDE